MVITAQTERCRQCHGLMASPPEPRVCTTCGRVRTTPRHEEWPRSLKRWVTYQVLRRHFHPWLTPQDAWERLLVGFFTDPASTHRQLRPVHDADPVYAQAVRMAEEWEARGAPMELERVT